MKTVFPLALALVLTLTLFATAPVAGQAGTLDEARELHLAGDFDRALVAYAEVAAARRDDDPETAARALHNRCAILLDRGDYRGAGESCESALELRRPLGETVGLGRTLNNLGLAYQHLGRLDEAKGYFDEALTINRRLDDRQGQAINLGNLGITELNAGRYGEALRRFAAMRRLAEDHPSEAWAEEQARIAQLNRGVVLEKLGAYREALDLYRGLLANLPAGRPRSEAALQVNAGVMYRNLGDPWQAIETLEKAVSLYQQLGDRAALSNAHLNLGLVRHRNLGRLEEAEADFRRAVELARLGGDRAEEVQDLIYLGLLQIDLGRLEEAEGTLRDGLRLAVDSGFREGIWGSHQALGRVAEAAEDPAALGHFLAAIEEIERVRGDLDAGRSRAGYFLDKRPAYAAAARLTLAAGDPRGALELVHRAKARELTEALGRDQPMRSARDLEDLVAEVGSGLLLEFFFVEERLLLWTIGQGGVRAFDLGEKQLILKTVTDLHRDLAGGREPNSQALQALSDLLLRPLQDALVGIETVWLAPDGLLHYLPFDLLPWRPDSPEPWVEQAALRYLPSGAALHPASPRAPSDAYALISVADPALPLATPPGEADPLAGRFDLPPLPGARLEQERIAALWPEPRLLLAGAAASEEALVQGLRRGARIVHLGTHSLVDERMRGGAAILLGPEGEADGWLRPEEIAALRLQVDLTILASCRSALGAEGGDAMATLTGALLAAGSGAVVATLWEVGDQQTAVFMEQFHDRLRRGDPPAEALRAAKLRLREDPRWSRPDLWAGYVLVGDAPPLAAGRASLPWAGIWILAAAVVGMLAAWRWRRSARGPQPLRQG